ncbi:Refilin-B [Varanus komodoensis]|nr:Refilin-B [Varanus komodoensis]
MTPLGGDPVDLVQPGGGQDASLSLHPPPGCALRLCPLSFGEGVEFDPLPPKDIRYTSSVKYDSEKHFINNIYMPMGLGMSSCSQTVVCVPSSTWRNYKAEVRFRPRNKAQSFTSTTIIYPKHTKTVYTTTLDYNGRKSTQRFLSSVELESSGKARELQDC